MGEGFCLLADVVDVSQRVVLLDGDKALGIGVGKRAQQHAVDDAEDGGVGADAERESEYGDDGESRRFSQHSQRVAKIAEEILEELHAALVAAFLFQLLCAADE